MLISRSISLESITVWPDREKMLQMATSQLEPGDNLVIAEGVHQGIVYSCDDSDVRVVHFDKEGVHCDRLEDFWPADKHMMRVNYNRVDRDAVLEILTMILKGENPFCGCCTKDQDKCIKEGAEDMVEYCLCKYNLPEIPSTIKIPALPPPRKCKF